jgi:hypothetical protein
MLRLRQQAGCTLLAAPAAGYTSILPAEEVAAIAAGRRTAGLPSWRDFKEDMEEGAVKFPSIAHPFLFAGGLRHAPQCTQTVQQGCSISRAHCVSERG